MGGKLKLVLSDLHLGAGRAREGGNALEDFVADEQLVSFLHRVAQESEQNQQEVELIINGDLFEFLQTPAVETYDPRQHYPRESYRDSSEAASVRRLDTIVQGHQEIFNALSDFMHVESPQRRITVIKGNHDVNLYWPGVKGRLRELLGATGPRASLLLFAEEFVSREKIYVEHGHQRTEKFNRFPDFLDPRLPDEPTHLYHPAGSRFVINFLNEVEYDRWFIDSVKPVTTMIWYAFRWDFFFAVKTLTAFLRYAPDLVVNSFAAAEAGQPPADPFIQELEDDRKLQEMAARYEADPAFRQQFNQQVQARLGEAVAPASGGALAMAPPEAEADPAAMAEAVRELQHNAMRRAAEEIAAREGARVVLFGHIHAPTEERLGSGVTYINTGCWLWTEDFSEATPETWEALFKGTHQPDQVLGRLPYARIEYDEQGNPTARLLNFANHDEPAPTESSSPGFFARILGWLARLLGLSVLS